MPRIPELRVIIESEPHAGVWNMAVDEVLLQSAIESHLATLRFYQWKQPTVSLGYFQKSFDLECDDALRGLPVVRRLSGGGAILHDNELTYSLALPASQNLYKQPHELYDIAHGAICRGLQTLGFSVRLRGSSVKRVDEPLLCFQRQDAHDVTLNGCKVLGSAQRRRRGAILQHGSLIRRASFKTPDLPGLEDLSAARVPENLAEVLAHHLATEIAESWIPSFLSENELELSTTICDQSSS